MKRLLADWERIMNRQTRRTVRRTTTLAICLLALVGCSSVRPVINTSPVIAIAAMSGTPQAHEVNGAFGSPLVAMVTNNGSPAAGVVVTFSAPTTGAGGTFANTSTATATATTNASGLATTALFMANGTAGTYAVTALASGATTPASFTLTNTIGAPAGVHVARGLTQNAPINGTFAPFMVTVLDGGGNPVSNAVVTFTASTSSSGASGTFASNGTNTETDTSAANGVAVSSVFTANAISGSYTVTVAVGGISANLNLTNTAGAPATITASSGTPQNTQIGTPFSAPLVATVLDSLSNPVNGVAVTFTAPASGASGTFTNGTATETDATNSAGVATSTAFTANSTTGSYIVTATTAGLTPAVFNLTNQVASTTYIFYLSGQQASSYYALAGAVQIDGSGNVLGGVQDYNNGLGVASPQPSGDTIIAASGGLVVDSNTGQGTLTLTTNNTGLGVAGVETLGVQFVNGKHALIIEFDGAATSSGSMDLQTATTLPATASASYAFTLSGVDPVSSPVAFGGIFSITGGTTLNGSFDINDDGVVLAQPSQTAWVGTVSAPPALGRGTMSGLSNPTSSSGATAVALNYYIVGPEVIRMIDVDTLSTVGTNDSAVGSAFGQGAASGFTLGNSVFGIAGVPFEDYYAAAGMLSPSSGTFTGIADDNELAAGVQPSDVSITGSYSIPTNGYGNLTITAETLGDVSVLGLYMTDPNLNLLDPNNTTTGLGGGLIADMDPVAFVAGGTGILLPQTDSSVASFSGSTNTYAFGAQDIDVNCCEFDFVGQGSFASGVLTGTGLVSDPLADLSGDLTTNSGVTFSATPLPDPSNVGRYTMLSANTVPNPLNITIGGTAYPFNVIVYQASGDQLLWFDEDGSTLGSVFLGSLQQQQLPLSGIPGARKGVVFPHGKTKR
jgi:hypothetical protein